MNSPAPATELPAAGVLLASASPRRLHLLQQMALPVAVWAADVDETRYPEEAPEDYVQRLSRAKCARAAQVHKAWFQAAGQQRVIIAADTTVVAGAAVLGKPADPAAGRAMLAALSGRSHQVMTGVTVAAAGASRTALVSASVRFRELSDLEIDRYVAGGEGRDKAGGYGIQGIGGIFVEHLSGSYSTVVGLPVATVETLLLELGIDTWRLREHD